MKTKLFVLITVFALLLTACAAPPAPAPQPTEAPQAAPTARPNPPKHRRQPKFLRPLRRPRQPPPLRKNRPR